MNTGKKDVFSFSRICDNVRSLSTKIWGEMGRGSILSRTTWRDILVGGDIKCTWCNIVRLVTFGLRVVRDG